MALIFKQLGLQLGAASVSGPYGLKPIRSRRRIAAVVCAQRRVGPPFPEIRCPLRIVRVPREASPPVILRMDPDLVRGIAQEPRSGAAVACLWYPRVGLLRVRFASL